MEKISKKGRKDFFDKNDRIPKEKLGMQARSCISKKTARQ